jgi:Short C-terminal domain
MEADQLEAMQTLMRILDLVATWLWAIALVCWALAVYLSPGRRLKTIRGIGFGLAFVGLLILVILRVAGNFVVESLVKVESNRPAAESVLDIVTALLRTSALTLFAIGVLVIVGTWLAGAGRRATAFRRWSAPLLREHPEAVWGVFAFLVLLVLIWGPIRATRNLVGIVLLVGLASLGLWAFRRATLLEFPDEPWRGWRLPRRGSHASSEEDRVAQLERLNALHQQGALTKQEFEAEKAALLGA